MSSKSGTRPVTMLVSYYPKAGKEKELLHLLERHWPTLRRIGLATDVAAQIWRATDKRTKRGFFLEMFQWKNAEASDRAHHTAEVMTIWEGMESILEDMQLTQIEPLSPPFAV